MNGTPMMMGGPGARFTSPEKWIAGVAATVLATVVVAGATAAVLGYSKDQLHTQGILSNADTINRIETTAKEADIAIGQKLDKLIDQVGSISSDLAGIRAVQTQGNKQ